MPAFRVVIKAPARLAVNVPSAVTAAEAARFAVAQLAFNKAVVELDFIQLHGTVRVEATEQRGAPVRDQTTVFLWDLGDNRSVAVKSTIQERPK